MARRRRIRTGELVTVPFPNRPVLAEVVEDRGNVGWRGRHIVRVRFVSQREDEGSAFEMPVDELTFLNEDPATQPPPVPAWATPPRSPVEKRRKPRRLAVYRGQKVIFPSVGRYTLAEVIEDRGFIGVGGRQILRVRTLEEMEEVRRVSEVPAEEVTPLD